MGRGRLKNAMQVQKNQFLTSPAMVTWAVSCFKHFLAALLKSRYRVMGHSWVTQVRQSRNKSKLAWWTNSIYANCSLVTTIKFNDKNYPKNILMADCSQHTPSLLWTHAVPHLLSTVSCQLTGAGALQSADELPWELAGSVGNLGSGVAHSPARL